MGEKSLKIEQLVAFQAVRVGQEVANCFNAKDFDITYRDPFFRVTRKNNGDSVLIPIHNVPYLKADDGDTEKTKIRAQAKRSAD
jgi:hypothetical protein